MKTKRVIIFSLLFVFTSNVFSQTFDGILKTIEKNNMDLQAGNKYVESKSNELRQHNLPEGPELMYGYFPKNNTVPGTKEVFEISQSFQMPCFYKNHTAYSKLMIGKEELSQSILRQNILDEAKSLMIEYIYLRKKLAIMDKRLKFADDIHNASLIRLELGDANALEINKAKLHLMQVQKQVKEAQTEISAIKEKLKSLNGGEDIDLTVDNYPIESLIEIDSVLLNRLSVDPELLYSQKSIEASQKQLKVTKNLQLPKFSLGYGTETVADEKFKGFLVGVSIPLWSSKRAIQQARFETQYYDLSAISINQSKISETNVLYKNALSLEENLSSYKTVLSSVNSEELLNQSLEAGEISIIDFFTEMFYYYEVYDDFLTVEKDYHQALAELYKYRL
jgi:outer membrane protein TolC